MPKRMGELFASKDKATSTEIRTKALMALYVEMLLMLVSKNILSSDEVREIFSAAVEHSSLREGEMIEGVFDFYMHVANPNDQGDSSNENHQEEEDTETE